MIEGEDFTILKEEADLENGQLAPILILKGKYAGVKFKYGTVEVNKHPDKAALVRLKFQYVLIDNAGLDYEVDKEKEFVEVAGEILNKIILDRYSKGGFVKTGEYNGNR